MAGIASLLLYPEDESGDSTQPEDEDSEAGETDVQDAEADPPVHDGELPERRVAPHSMQWAIRSVHSHLFNLQSGHEDSKLEKQTNDAEADLNRALLKSLGISTSSFISTSIAIHNLRAIKALEALGRF